MNARKKVGNNACQQLINLGIIGFRGEELLSKTSFSDKSRENKQKRYLNKSINQEKHGDWIRESSWREVNAITASPIVLSAKNAPTSIPAPQVDHGNNGSAEINHVQVVKGLYCDI